ncbi:GNAT family N-acetyltransferase [Actinoplanes sp. NPDC020271]|uniref:GNAT family N-acetyltransferase n=1 Tax=Actinoplanes sp. NPDC020271 TaxID=3363896 RepID=UPI00379C92D9
MGVTVRELDGMAEWTGAAALYREVFGYTEPEWGLSPRLLAALGENAGTVIGAFTGDDMLTGFCYGFTGIEAGEVYHYSQAAVVRAGFRGAGLGRLLKYAQARAARRTGARAMRWTFDPYALRNAHFNFAVLGATGIRFLPDFYREPGTDRVLVSWDLTDSDQNQDHRRTRRWGRPGGESVLVAAGESFAAPDPQDRAWLRQELVTRFATGRRLVGVVRPEGDPGRVAYLFEEEA